LYPDPFRKKQPNNVHNQPGTNVTISKNTFAPKLGIFSKNNTILRKHFLRKHFCRKLTKIAENRRKSPKIAENRRKSPKIAENRRKSPKIAENCDHNIGPCLATCVSNTIGNVSRVTRLGTFFAYWAVV
jgi:hypothetical protein